MYELEVGPDLGAEPTGLFGRHRRQPGEPGVVCLRTRARARAPCGVQASPGAATRPGGARQHQGLSRYLRESGPRDLARGPEIHRNRPPARRFPAWTTSGFLVTWRIRPPRRRRRLNRTLRISRRMWRLAPRRRFGWGGRRFEQKLKLEEGITLSADKLLAIALRELAEVQEEFRSVAGRLNGGDPMDAWKHAKERHPEPGTLVAVAQEQMTELEDVSPDTRDCVAPRERAGRRRPVAGVLSLGVCEHVDAGAVREQTQSRVLLPDRRRSHVAGRSAEGAHAGLQRPGAVEHLHPRGLPGALPPLPASPAGGLEGAQSRSSSPRLRLSKAGRITASR